MFYLFRVRTWPLIGYLMTNIYIYLGAIIGVVIDTITSILCFLYAIIERLNYLINKLGSVHFKCRTIIINLLNIFSVPLDLENCPTETFSRRGHSSRAVRNNYKTIAEPR